MNCFHSFYIDEPDLIFGGQGEDKDPRIGLKEFGPYYSSSEQEPSPSQIRIGIIGSGETLTLTKQLLGALKNPIPSDNSNRWLYPDYPGFSKESRVKSELINSDRWNASITHTEINNVLGITDVNNRIAAAVELYLLKIQAISMEEDTPHVIICSLPHEIEEYCGISRKTRGAKKPKFTELEKKIGDLKDKGQSFLTEWGINPESLIDSVPEKDYDLHNAMKGKAMKFGIPIQVLRESSLNRFHNYQDKGEGQNRATFAWNLSMGLYYKANGRPWRLAKLTVGTCYIGISFYKNLRNPKLNLESSMAQLFTHSGEGFVLRGTDVYVDEETKEPHLSEEQSYSLLMDVLDKYKIKTGSPPNRVVLHKTSMYTEEEKNGFRKALGGCHSDFISIKKYTPLRAFRIGEYPVLRGTVIQLTPREYLLFSGGYIPRLRTYPGHKVPEPLHIIHEGDSDAEKVCREILGLTKLNWNTTSFATNKPITIEFAYRVGAILSELKDEKTAEDHYRFYM